MVWDPFSVLSRIGHVVPSVATYNHCKNMKVFAILFFISVVITPAFYLFYIYNCFASLSNGSFSPSFDLPRCVDDAERFSRLLYVRKNISYHPKKL